MYKKYPKESYLQRYGFSSDYKVDGVLVYGGWKDKYYDYFKEALDRVGVEYRSKFIEYPFLKNILEVQINNKVYWFTLAYGSAMLSEHLHIACLFGSEKNILFGSCGGLDKNSDSRDIILPIEVFGEESSAKLYSQLKDNLYRPDPGLVQSINKRIGTKYKVIQGKTVTCQAMLGESWEDVVSWSKDGYVGVEMEAGTVFSVSTHFNVPSAALLIIGDNLIKDQTIYDDEYVKNQDLRKNVQDDMFEVVVKELLGI